MRALHVGLIALLLPAVAHGQTTAGAAVPPPYRGLTPGISYRAFVERANALADRDVLACHTSPHTAQLMECGVVIRDPSDGARFYLAGHFIEQNADLITLYDSAGFHDGGGPALVARMQRDLARVFGAPRRRHAGTWEWSWGRRVARLTWRARGSARWISVTLTDGAVMDRIGRYVKTSHKP